MSNLSYPFAARRLSLSTSKPNGTGQEDDQEWTAIWKLFVEGRWTVMRVLSKWIERVFSCCFLSSKLWISFDPTIGFAHKHWHTLDEATLAKVIRILFETKTITNDWWWIYEGVVIEHKKWNGSFLCSQGLATPSSRLILQAPLPIYRMRSFCCSLRGLTFLSDSMIMIMMTKNKRMPESKQHRIAAVFLLPHVLAMNWLVQVSGWVLPLQTRLSID